MNCHYSFKKEVIINGRELPQAEWAVWSQVLGYWIQRGSYWFDSNGNAGYEGNQTGYRSLPGGGIVGYGD